MIEKKVIGSVSKMNQLMGFPPRKRWGEVLGLFDVYHIATARGWVTVIGKKSKDELKEEARADYEKYVDRA